MWLIKVVELLLTVAVYYCDCMSLSHKNRSIRSRALILYEINYKYKFVIF